MPELDIGQIFWISDLRKKGEIESRHRLPRSYLVRRSKGYYRRNRKLHPLPHTEEEQTKVNEDAAGRSLDEQCEITEQEMVEVPVPASPSPHLRGSTRQILPPQRLDL